MPTDPTAAEEDPDEEVEWEDEEEEESEMIVGAASAEDDYDSEGVDGMTILDVVTRSINRLASAYNVLPPTSPERMACGRLLIAVCKSGRKALKDA